MRSPVLTWSTADSLEDLGELMARWLEGAIPSRPAYTQHCGPDRETSPLIPTLAACCRAGFLTDCSQPGMTGRHHRQRAAVSGLITDNTLLRTVTEQARRAGLTVVVNGHPGPVLVTEVGASRQPHTWFGHNLAPGDLSYLWYGINEMARTDLWLSHQVALIDPVYGPSDRLWRLLDRVSGRRTR